MKLNYQRRQRAFLIMDVLVALAVFGTGIFIAVTFIRAEVRETRNIVERQSAMLLAQSEIERMRLLPYDQLAVGEDQKLALTLPSAQRLKESYGALTVHEIEPGVKEALVGVHWSSPTGRPLKVEMTAQFSREGSQ
jgi:hypothetical protein